LIYCLTWTRGITTTYAYDNGGSQIGITYSDGTTPSISYTLDRLGRATSITDAAGTRTKSYNTDSTLASESVQYIVNHSVNYGYDTLGRRTSMNLMNSSTSVLSNTYGYDAMSRLASVGSEEWLVQNIGSMKRMRIYDTGSTKYLSGKKCH